MYYLVSDRHLPTCWSSPLEMMLMYEKAAPTYGRAHVTPPYNGKLFKSVDVFPGCYFGTLVCQQLDFSFLYCIISSALEFASNWTLVSYIALFLRHFSLPAIGL